MRTVRFAAAARDEFLAEVAFYNEAQAGLGQRFTEAIEKAVALALAFPSVGSPLKSGTRRVVVKDFPFSLIYKPLAQDIVVYAVAHQSRRPMYWLSRVGHGG